MKNKLILYCIFLLCITLGSAQSISVTGTVVDENNIPILGVNIIEKNTKNGVATNFDGNYSIVVAPESVLVFSYLGYKTQEVKVAQKKSINVVLQADLTALDEVVVQVGYGSINKSDLTGSVTRADISAFKDQPNVSIIQSLQGTVPGLNVGTVTGPGQNPGLSVRGRNSLSGSSAPLIVLDGVIYRGSLVELNAADIESVDILKDASSKAIYGSQAANGVLLVTSKKGKKNKEPVFNVSTYYAAQRPSSVLTPLNREEYLEKNRNFYYPDSKLAPDYIQTNPDWDINDSFIYTETQQGYLQGTNTDWLDLVTQNAYSQNIDASMAGATEKLSYFVSVGNLSQDGYVKNDQYNKTSLRANFENEISNWLTIGMQSFLTSGNYDGVAADLSNAYLLHPMVKPYNDDGTLNDYPLGSIPNPLRNLEVDDFDRRLNLFGNFYAKVEIPEVKGLSYKINYSTNYRTRRYYQFNPYANNNTGGGFKENGQAADQSLDNVLNYKNTFNENHSLDLTLLYGYEKRDSETSRATGNVFLNDVLGYNRLEAGDPEFNGASSGAWDEAALYQMGRLNYKYNNKYLATLTVRRDGFSGFGSNTKFGVFPSAAIAWNLGKENFVINTLPQINDLKLRLSYGKSGNRTVGRYGTLATVSAGYVYQFGDGGSSAYGQTVSSLANDNLGWESTTGANYGLDLAIFNNRITATVDYYTNQTEDILFNINLPRITGFTTIASNIGSVKNKGLEISLSSVNVDTEDFSWNTSFSFSQNKNKIRSILGRDDDGDGVEDDLISNGLFIGRTLGTIYNYKVLGIYQVGDDIPAGYQPGHYILEDVSGPDGVPDGVISAEYDRQFLGDTNPAYRISMMNNFRYKNWSLSAFFNSIQGGENGYLSSNNPRHATGWWSPSNFDNVNAVKEFDFWYPGNENAKYAQTRIEDPRSPSLYKTRSFIRLQDLNLKYSFPDYLVKNLQIDALSIFFSGKNLYTWTDWIGADPETASGFALGAYPVMKTYSFGLNLTF